MSLLLWIQWSIPVASGFTIYAVTSRHLARHRREICDLHRELQRAEMTSVALRRSLLEAYDENKTLRHQLEARF